MMLGIAWYFEHKFHSRCPTRVNDATICNRSAPRNDLFEDFLAIPLAQVTLQKLSILQKERHTVISSRGIGNLGHFVLGPQKVDIPFTCMAKRLEGGKYTVSCEGH